MVVTAVDRLFRDEVQGVVHPPHVPLEAEAQAARVGRVRHARPRGRFLGDRDGAGRMRIRRLVGLAQEVDGIEVLVAAVLIGDPLALPARVIEVEHRGDGIHAQTVEVVVLQPETGIRGEEGRHFRPPEIVDVGAPILVEALPRVGMLVEMGPVELAEPMGVQREMARHPVEHHADAGLVGHVDEGREVIGRAETARRRE